MFLWALSSEYWDLFLDCLVFFTLYSHLYVFKVSTTMTFGLNKKKLDFFNFVSLMFSLVKFEFFFLTTVGNRYSLAAAVSFCLWILMFPNPFIVDLVFPQSFFFLSAFCEMCYLYIISLLSALCFLPSVNVFTDCTSIML